MEELAQTWTEEELRSAYTRLEQHPIVADTYRDQLPPKLERRYIVTGGCGLVGGYLVLQLLARGHPPEAIRIVDFQPMLRRDMLNGPARHVDVVHTDIASADSTDAAFSKKWPSNVAQLPLTVFHTAAIIVPSDRSPLVYGVLERVNVGGTRNVLAASKRAGADILVSTSSASIALRPVHFWVSPGAKLMGNFVQRLDEADFFEKPRPHEGYYCNYAVSKAAAERIVCGANCSTLRTGSLRPANGIYGHPTDNTVGRPMNEGVTPAWSYNIVNSFVHGANCAVAHLNFEAVLAAPDAAALPQAGRPFTVTDPNRPIQFRTLWSMLELLCCTPVRTLPLPPAPMLLVAYAIEWYSLLPFRHPWLSCVLPPVTGDARHLKPPLFTIVSHAWANNDPIQRPVEDGGLGYKGVIGTQDGMVQQVVEWNKEHANKEESRWVKYRSSVATADDHL